MWADDLKCFGLLADRDQAGLLRLGRGRNTSKPQLETEGFVYAASIRLRYRFGGPAERAWLWARALGKSFNGEAPWAILAFYFVRLPKSVQIRNIESSEFGPAVAICPVYIEARFEQIAEPMSLVWGLPSALSISPHPGWRCVLWNPWQGPQDQDKNRGHYLLKFLSCKSTNDQTWLEN